MSGDARRRAASQAESVAHGAPTFDPQTFEPLSAAEWRRLLELDEALRAGMAGNAEDGDPAASDSVESHDSEGLAELLRVLHRFRPGSKAVDGPGDREAPVLPERPSPAAERFLFRRELGRGSFGVVFLAFDTQLGREVALKLPGSNVMANESLRKRFQQEWRAAAALDHPFIVPVYDAAEIGSFCYIASAFCPGPSLHAWIRRRRTPVAFDQAARLVARLAEAIDHAHHRGVVHRDLKPGNVLLTPCQDGTDYQQVSEEGTASTRQGTTVGLDAGDVDTRRDATDLPLPTADPAVPETEGTGDLDQFVPRITDFGLAKLAGSGDDLTRSGAVMGTPGYMAPEQARGATRTVGPAADIYALGAILYELLTGRPPFQGESDVDVLLQAESVEPVQPTRLRPKIPGDLETICLKCLQKDPARRFEKASDLEADLRRFLEGRPIHARPISSAERAWRLARRNPAVSFLLTALAVLVFASLITVTRLWTRAEQSAEQAESQRQLAQTSYRMARDAFQTASDDILNDPRVKMGPFDDMRRSILESQVGFYEQFLDLQGDGREFLFDRATALRLLGRARGRLGDADPALEAYHKSRAALAKLVARYPDDAEYLYASALVAHGIGSMQLRKGDFQLAETELKQSMSVFQRLVREDPSEARFRTSLARVSSDLALGYNFQFRNIQASGSDEEKSRLLAQSTRYFHQAIDVIEERPDVVEDNAPFLLGTFLYNLGMIALFEEDWEEAESSILACIEHVGQVPEDHSDAAEARLLLAHASDLLASVYGKTDRPDEQLQVRRAALDSVVALVEDYPQVTRIRVLAGNLQANHGSSLFEAGRPEESLEFFEQAAENLNSLLERNASHVQAREFLRNAHYSWARALVSLERYEEALPHWDSAVELDQGQYRPWYRLQKARTLARLARTDEAVAVVDDVLALPDVRPDALYNSACALVAVAEQFPDDPDRVETLHLRAIGLLQRCREAGYDKIEKLRDDSELDPLRSRSDFAPLLVDL